MNRHDRATVDTNLTGAQDRIDLVEQNGKLQQSLQGLSIFQLGHKLEDAGYATRVAECTAASDALGVGMLSDLGLEDMGRIEALEPPLDRRARHIVTENDRVRRGVEALSQGDVATFARLMIASHRSQSEDYAVSLPQIDALVEGALNAGAIGARLTGGGFGGSIVALVARDQLDTLQDRLTTNFPTARILAAI